MDRTALVYVLLFWRKRHIDHVRRVDRNEHDSNPRTCSYEEKECGGYQAAWRLARLGLRGIPGC